MTRRATAAIAAGCWVAVVGALTLTANPARGQRLNLRPGLDLTDPDLVLADVAVNLVLFVPFGVIAVVAGLRWWVPLLASLALSAGIETAQWFMAAGRAADVNDVAANVAGAALGFTAAAVVRRPAARTANIPAGRR